MSENNETLVTKITRIRKLTITPTVTDTTLSLSVDVIDHGITNLNLEVGELPQQLLHQLALRGISSFIHDRTGSIKDVSKLPKVITDVFVAVKDGTIFSATRTPNDTVVLPKFVEAAMVKDGLDVSDTVVRQSMLADWNVMSDEDKKAMRQDPILMNIVTILNAREAEKALAEAGIKF